MECLNDFSGKKTKKVYTISYINNWLLTYSDIYIRTYKMFYQQYRFELEDGSVGRLPPCGKTTEQEKFLDLYEALNSISEFHRNEAYFEQQMILYQEIKKSNLDIMEWVINNKELGSNKYITFLIDYLDYDVDEKVEDLKVFVPSLKNINIYIARKEFKNTLKFLETFNELYWVQKIEFKMTKPS